MSRLFPTEALGSVTEITRELLESYGVRGLIIDIDNTLTHHNSPEIDPQVVAWLEEIKKEYPAILLSNNHRPRVEPFAKMVGMDFLYNAAKPLPSKGLGEAARRLKLEPSQLAVVGDQIFTDVLGGNLLGAVTLRVEPIQTEGGWFFNLKRLFEGWVMKRYHKQKGGSQ